MCDDVVKGGVDASRDKNAEEMQARCSDESSRHRNGCPHQHRASSRGQTEGLTDDVVKVREESEGGEDNNPVDQVR